MSALARALAKSESGSLPGSRLRRAADASGREESIQRERSRPGRSVLHGGALCALGVAASLLAVSSASAADPQRLSSHRIGKSKKWQGYDEAPAQALVHPVRVLEGVGEVSDPQALSQPASGETTNLTHSPVGRSRRS